MANKKIQFADDTTEPVKLLFKLRMPSLVIGLVLGMVLSFATSRFEEVLSKNIYVAFFIPFIVYLADAVGTQTQNIYARDLKSGKAGFKKYLIKESKLGLMFGSIFALITIPIVVLWFGSVELALAVSLSVLGAVATAPLIALMVTEFIQLERSDPAVGAGPIATVIQDTVSVLIYGFIASALIL
jgi:Mg/Co/Ni transporter MgtE (contains CBS domain)